MALNDHYAVLLAINLYPGLRNLEGPENDIDAFADWLRDPNGGNVETNNIKTVKSTHFPPVVNPNDANPQERAFTSCLDQLMRDPARNWLNRVGTRLYIYMAGHGFTAGSSVSDPALFSAAAQNGDTSHIAGLRYASKIANAGFFDEIILVMDCCQDVLKSSQVVEPSWSPPDRNKTSQVKLLQAYGAPRGQAAFERELMPGGPKRGFFSTVLIEALRSAKPHPSNGFVTGTTLKDQFQQLWNDRYKALTGYNPPLIPPSGVDIELFARSAVPSPANGVLPVTFALDAPIPAGATLDITSGVNTAPILSMPATALQPQTLPPGFYKATLSATGRSRLFEVTGATPTTVTL
jgi:hypothetical protein